MPSLRSKMQSLCWGLFLVLGAVHSSKAAQVHWGYKDVIDEEPPAQWQKDFPSCKGTRQSPIAINRTLVQWDGTLGPIEFRNYDYFPVNHTWTVVDNGHAVQFSATFPTGKIPTVRGGGLLDSYALTQFHFHWGSDDSRGSEHVVEGKRYPLELHIVHQKTTDDDINAGQDSTGLAVIGILFDLAGPADPPNAFLEEITYAIEVTLEPNRTTRMTLAAFNMAHLLSNSPDYYRYLGSLTTPPCSEAVVWSIMKTTMKITEKQLKTFRGLHEKPNDAVDLLEDNYRPLQSLNGRVIRAFSDSYTTSRVIGLSTIPPLTDKPQQVARTTSNAEQIASLFSRAFFVVFFGLIPATVF